MHKSLILAGLLVVSSRAGSEETVTSRPREAPPMPSAIDGDAFLVTEMQLTYAKVAPGQIPIEDVLRNVHVELVRTPRGYIAVREGSRGEAVRLGDVPALEEQRFFLSAIRAIAEEVRDAFSRYDQVAIVVFPDPDDLGRGRGGEIVDVREAGRTELRLKVLTGTVEDVRTLASGKRVATEERVNNSVHERIREESPVQPGDLVWKEQVESYAYKLSRHPGRRVDAALAGGAEPGELTLDYLVYERKPWFVFADVSNTGTEATTEWRQRFGFVHNQLTDHDDILGLQYITGGFDEVHGVSGSYEAPLFLLDDVRWQLSGSWSTYDATEVGQFLEEFDGSRWHVGGEVFWNVLQHKELFVDLLAGLRWESIDVDSRSTGVRGDEDFLIPRIGVRLDRITETDATSALLAWELNIAAAAGTRSEEIDRLGRVNAESNWGRLLFGVRHARYLDPLYFPDSWKDPESDSAKLAHELVLSLEAQVSGDRLVPQYQRTVGGLYTVRGYPEAATAGDSAVVGRFEYLYHVARDLPRAESWRLFGQPFRHVPREPYGRADWDLILRAFLDAGYAYNVDREPFETNETLVGAGLGLELVLWQNFSARVDWGVALVDALAAGTEVTAGSQRFHLMFVLSY